MFIVTAKLPRRKLALCALAAAGLACCALFLHMDRPHNPDTQAAAPSSTQKVKSAQDRLNYLTDLGWQAEEEPVSVEELIVPKEFDESYTDYLSLQTSQGFDLTDYRGKRVKRYTYRITNHPSGETGVQLNLLVYRDRVIGGEVLSPRPDGFLHGLAVPEGNTE